MAGASFRCRDVGVSCDFEIKGAGTKEEVLQMLQIHAKLSHKMDTIPEDLRSKIEKAIKT